MYSRICLALELINRLKIMSKFFNKFFTFFNPSNKVSPISNDIYSSNVTNNNLITDKSSSVHRSNDDNTINQPDGYANLLHLSTRKC